MVLSPWHARQSACAASWRGAANSAMTSRPSVTARCRRAASNSPRNHSAGPTAMAIKNETIRAALVMLPYLPPWCESSCFYAHGFPAADSSTSSENSGGDYTFEETLFASPLAVIVVTTAALMRQRGRFLSVTRATLRGPAIPYPRGWFLARILPLKNPAERLIARY